jgi:Cu-processing system ATP-binding protein
VKEEKMIKIKELKKSFGKNEALKGVSVEFGKGSICAVMGPNGSGKTTMLKSILGLVKPDGGSIEVNGTRVNGDPAYRKNIGYMPQYSCFPENLKVKEIVAMLKDIRGNHCTYDYELAEKLNIKQIHDKQVGTLSGGTKQRVSCAIAFLFAQDIIILDEPTAGLDPLSSEIVKQKILDEKEKGKLIIITSHIVSEVESLADRIIYMLEGKVYFDSTKEKLYSKTGEANLNKAIAAIIEQGTGS